MRNYKRCEVCEGKMPEVKSLTICGACKKLCQILNKGWKSANDRRA